MKNRIFSLCCLLYKLITFHIVYQIFRCCTRKKISNLLEFAYFCVIIPSNVLIMSCNAFSGQKDNIVANITYENPNFICTN